MTPPDAGTYAASFPAPRAQPGRPAQPAGAAQPARPAQRLAARKRRISLIRRRVVGVATALFLACSTGIFIQLVSGHDPALTRSVIAKASGSATSTSTSGSSTSTTGSNTSTTGSNTSTTGSNTSTTGSSSSGGGSNQTTAVTTSQS
jgi:hypothetical protein